jgi:tetratricopeptide (TPR) repeat protein
LFTVLKRYDEAIAAGKEAIRVDPNYADGHANLSQALTYAGRPKEALDVMSTAKRLNPHYAFFYTWIEGQAHMMLREYPEAIAKFEEVITRNAFFPGAHLTLAAIYGNIGPQVEAEWQAAELLALQPDFSLEMERERSPYKNKKDLEWYIMGLDAAGLPH